MLSPGTVSALSTADRRRLWREAAALSRGRLGRTRGAKIGSALSWGLLVAFAAATVATRFGDSAPTDLAGFGPTAARFAAWLAAGPIALSAANGRERGDRADGIDALAASFGVAPSALRMGRLTGVALACMRAIAIPAVGVSLVAAALSPSLAAATSPLLTAPVLLGFAIVAGAVLGILAVIAERIAPERGMRALVLLVVVPWAMSDLVGWSGASIPAALDALLTAALTVAGAAFAGMGAA